MKKLLVVLVSALAAGLFFGCSNGSDNNNAGLLLAANSSNGESYVTAKLPENVGVNPFVGKSFENNGEICKFDANYITLTEKDEIPANSDGNTKAYTIEIISTVKYAYNAETKNLYYSQPTPQKMIYKNADGEQYLYNITYNFSSEDEFIRSLRSKLENTCKVTGETFTEEFFNYCKEKSVGETRAQIFYLTSNLPDGYKDETYNTPLTPAQMAYYSKYMNYQMQKAAKVITCHAYDFDGEDLKISNRGNFPAGIKFGGIYNGTYEFNTMVTKNDSVVGSIKINVDEILDPNNTFNTLILPSIGIIKEDSSRMYLKVTSASDDSVTGILQVPASSRKEIEPVDLQDIGKMTIKLENETTSEKTTVTVKIPNDNGVYEVFGTFEIPYNKTIPEATYETFTKL